MKTIVKLTLVALLWSGVYTIGENTVNAVHPLSVAFIRFFLTTLCLFPILWWKEKETWKLQKQEWFPLIILGLLGISVYNAFFFLGLKESGAIKSSVIIAAIPMVTTLFASLLYRERMTINQIIGVLLSFGGVFLVVTEGSLQSIAAVTNGDLWLMGCVFLWSIYTIFGKKYMQRTPPLKYTSYTAFFGALFLFPFALFMGSLGTIFTASLTNWYQILYLVIFGTVISFFWWNQGVKEIGPGKTSIFLNLVPVFTALSLLVVGQTIQLVEWMGTILVITGVSLTNLKLRQSKKTAVSDEKTV
ncbi:DMT family transporter [Longirhabdus pacifica]|uniref:DMT family transporter n=1 Tax=Longirhabdus pacifica TaxID=2305227 RepID=UPI0010093801|nr:EamA family transporter [Longirhabdus pacifica]